MTWNDIKEYGNGRPRLYQDKKRRLEELEEAEYKQLKLLCRSKETREFYQKINTLRKQRIRAASRKVQG